MPRAVILTAWPNSEAARMSRMVLTGPAGTSRITDAIAFAEAFARGVEHPRSLPSCAGQAPTRPEEQTDLVDTARAGVRS